MHLVSALALPLLALIAAPVAAQPAAAPGELPAGVRAMIDAAIAGGDAKEITTVLNLARRVHPGAAEELARIETMQRVALAEAEARATEAKRVAVAEAGPLDMWKGQIELGASRSTGNTRSLGLFGALAAEREGVEWRHKLVARADVQENDGNRTTERVLASWQPNLKLGDRLYAFGLAQYEYDRFLGYDSRYTIGGGLGYGAVASERIKLDLEGGPAFRQTDRTSGEDETTVAGRASLNFSWKMTPTLELRQMGAVYLESGDTSANASTVLDTKLIGALKARFSYNIQYEHDAPPGAEPLDTLSRATLVYSF